MEALLLLYWNEFLVFILVLTRVSGMVTLTPIWGSRVIPVRVRAFLAIGLALIITPLVWDTPIDNPGNLLNLLVRLGGELAVGLSLGLAVTIYFAGLQLAGQIMGQMSGMSLANTVSPTSDATASIFSQLLNMIMLAIFVASGGHRAVLDALIQTFRQMPPGQAFVSRSLIDVLTEITQLSFTAGLQIAAPVMIALLLSILIMGLISRTLPQLNILAVGFSVNALVMLGALLLSLGLLARVFESQSFAVIDLLRPAFHHP